MTDEDLIPWETTSHLVDCAESWLELSEQIDVPEGVKLEARSYYEAIFHELGFKVKTA